MGGGGPPWDFPEGGGATCMIVIFTCGSSFCLLCSLSLSVHCGALCMSLFMYTYIQVPDVLTSSQGHPLESGTATLTIGERGPVPLQDYTFMDIMAH